MQLRAPAKINLSFRIHGLRPDRFHEIETLMSPISLYDELRIERAENPGIHFRCSDPSLSSGPDNLVVLAAALFFQSTGKNPAVDIFLHKKIPHGAGLGGGSSDAATALLGLNELFAANFSHEKLATLAAQIGADVPFFIYKNAAICRGRGDLVTSRALDTRWPLLLLKPSFGVPTPWAYSHWEKSQELPGVDYGEQKIDDMFFVNDLERPVFEKFIFLAQMKTWLRAQPEVRAALLSGSGSTLFAVLREDANPEIPAARARAELDPELWAFPCATI